MNEQDYSNIIERLLLELKNVTEYMVQYNVTVEEAIPYIKDYMPGLLMSLIRSVGIDKLKEVELNEQQ